MKYLAAYLLLQIGGNASPSAADIKSLFETVGIEAEEERLEKVVSELGGKDINEVSAGLHQIMKYVQASPNVQPLTPQLIAEGSAKFASVPSGGAGGAAAPAAAGGAAAGGAAAAEEAPAAKEEEAKEESDDDMVSATRKLQSSYLCLHSTSLSDKIGLRSIRLDVSPYCAFDTYRQRREEGSIWAVCPATWICIRFPRLYVDPFWMIHPFCTIVGFLTRLVCGTDWSALVGRIPVRQVCRYNTS
jgi:large subunit ribosomal protein LP2